MQHGRPGALHGPAVRSIDHVHPISAGKHLNRSRIWLELNEVVCCQRCNNLKDSMSPLAWLRIMPAYGVSDLAARLQRMGIASGDIQAAISLRAGARV
jgi:hypothetical protein